MEEFYQHRLTTYGMRKKYLLKKLKKELETLSNKARFIKEVNAGLIKVTGVKKQVICDNLKSRGFATLKELTDILDEEAHVPVTVANHDQENSAAPDEEEEKLQEGQVGVSQYNYLLSMPIFSLT
jgi:DNA topoisomerase-2